MADETSIVLFGSAMLFLGGALTALGLERMYWKLSPILARRIIDRKVPRDH